MKLRKKSYDDKRRYICYYESGALALAISVGGVLLMDAEEKSGEKK